MKQSIDEKFDKKFGILLYPDSKTKMANRHIKQFYSKEISKLLEEILNIELNNIDIRDVGEHYWGGDYYPEENEVEKLRRIFDTKINYKLKNIINKSEFKHLIK